MKVVINRCFGGFQLSREACEYLGLDKDRSGFSFCDHKSRTDQKLIECVEKLGEQASGIFAFLKVVEIPDDIEWYIHDYDGLESIHEKHRVWT